MVFAIHQYASAVRIYVSPPSYTFLPSSLSHPSRLSQSTSFGCPGSYIKLPLAVLHTVLYRCQCYSLSFLFSFIFISWRLITLQYCSGFCHTLTWISHGFTYIPIPILPPTSLSTQFLWVFPVHQAQALVSCIQPGLVICFTLNNIHVSVLFSRNIPPLPSPTEAKSLFCTSHRCVSFSVLHIGLSLPSF